MRKGILLVCLLILLGGCEALPGEEHSFAVALCLDVQDGEWLACARIPSYQEEGRYLTLTARAFDLEQALHELSALAPMQLDSGQTRIVVLGEKLAASDRLPFALQTLARQKRMRLGAALLVTQEPIEQLCGALEPATGKRLSKSLDVMLETRAAQGAIPRLTLGEAVRWGGREGWMLARISLLQDENEGEKPGIHLGGCYAVNLEGRAAAVLNEGETALYALLKGQIKKGKIALSGGVFDAAEIRARVTLAGDEVWVRVRIKGRDTDEAAGGQLSDEIQALIVRLRDAACDSFGLAQQAMREYWTWDEWLAARWKERFRTMVWRMDVAVG